MVFVAVRFLRPSSLPHGSKGYSPGAASAHGYLSLFFFFFFFSTEITTFLPEQIISSRHLIAIGRFKFFHSVIDLHLNLLWSNRHAGYLEVFPLRYYLLRSFGLTCLQLNFVYYPSALQISHTLSFLFIK